MPVEFAGNPAQAAQAAQAGDEQLTTEEMALLQELMKPSGQPTGSGGMNDLFSKTDYVKVIEAYLKTHGLEDAEFTKKFWAFLGSDIKLTFLNNDDLVKYDLLYSMARLDYLMDIAPYEFDFDTLQKLDQLKSHVQLAVSRSIGTDKQLINERTMQASSIHHNISSATSTSRELGGGGRGGGLGGVWRKITNMI